MRHLQTLFDAGTVGELTDGQLVERFTTHDGGEAELAFTVLVERHGPMVLRICRSILRDSHDAEDAFQATFLVLIKRSRSLWVRDSLGPWLHQVAYRASSHAQTESARRRRIESQAAGSAPRSSVEAGPDDLGEVLQEEMDRLPERYRAAVMLCLLEGLSLDQAARRLGWPLGTVQSRLARGRQLLRERLTRRGLAPSAGAFAAALAAERARAAVPAGLTELTVRAAMRVMAGSTAGAVPTVVCVLTEGVMRTMSLAKLKIAATALLVTGLVVGGAGVLAQQQQKTRSEDLQWSREFRLTDKHFEGIKSLKEALEVVKQELIRNGKAEYAPLLSEQRVRDATRSGIRNYEVYLDKAERQVAGSKGYFIEVKPVFLKIAEEGAWPPNCSFFGFYSINSSVVDGKSIMYDGFWLRLKVNTLKPKQKFGGFALPILDMAYGKIEL